jgi:hypothetical protein
MIGSERSHYAIRVGCKQSRGSTNYHMHQGQRIRASTAAGYAPLRRLSCPFWVPSADSSVLCSQVAVMATLPISPRPQQQQQQLVNTA